MRIQAPALVVLLGLAARLPVSLSAQTAPPVCTGLCLQQVACPAGTSTTISGKVYTPNGTDPLPNVQVYIPNAPVEAFTPGVSCPVFGAPPSGSPLVGTTTGVDGSFVLSNVPVGTDIPVVAVTGRWRRQVTVATTAACVDTAQNINMPRNKAEGDIPRFAVATGSADSVECVLRKVGIDDAEFTDPSGTGRINLFTGSGSPGARASTASLPEGTLMGDSATLNQYDVLMLPCEGDSYARSATQLANLVGFANAGGRVYASHFAYVWMYQNPPFNGVVTWNPRQASLTSGIATVDTSFSEGQTLAQWLQLVGATTTLGQMPIQTIRKDFNGVVAPTQSWLTLNNAALGNPTMQFVFDAPVGAKSNQCGRVLFNEYHVEDPVISSPDKIFPAECNSGIMTPQEKLLEFSLFELTSDGGAPTLSPTKVDFGDEAVGFTSAFKAFTWTNNSTFGASVTNLTASGDFSVVSSNCSSVAAGASCQINVVFTPTATGARTGVLTVGSSGTTLTAALTGNGIPALVYNLTALDFGNVDVGARVTRSLGVANTAPGAVTVPPLVIKGDYSVVTSCGTSLAVGATCTIGVTFTPTATGPRPGTLAVNSTSAAYPSTPVPLTGNGVDFAVTSSAGSGSVIAGRRNIINITVSPIAGFANPIAMSCTTSLPASTCVFNNPNFTPVSAVTTAVTITTTSKYTVIGYGGAGGNIVLVLFAFGSGWLVWTRRQTAGLVRIGCLIVLVSLSGLMMTGCSGKLPAQNASYSPPGNYTVTLSATDGFLTHSVTYNLKVTAN